MFRFWLCVLLLSKLCFAGAGVRRQIVHESNGIPYLTAGPLPAALAQTTPTTFTSSGIVEVILPTTDAKGSSIDILGTIITGSSGIPSTIFQPITQVITGPSGPETSIGLPIVNGQGSLVIATGLLTTDASGKPTTSFGPLAITNSAATAAITEIVIAVSQSGGSVAYELGTLSSVSGEVETLVGGSQYVAPGTLSASNSGSSTFSATTSSNGPTQSITSVPGPNGFITTTSSLGSSKAMTGTQSSGTPVTTDIGTTTGSAHSSSPTITPGGFTTSTSATGLGTYPSSITFLTQSNGQTVVGVAFITTDSSGHSIITNTVPSQSAVGTGEIVVSAGGTSTTIEISTLPSATPLPSGGTDQVVTESGVPVTYSPITLSGYQDITQPFELSTNFVEVVNGQTTTQGGFWLIGAGGVIDPPKGRPWKIGGELGCIGGPLLCNMPGGSIDIGGGFGIHLPGLHLPKGTTGPPGYPGGPVGGASGEPDEPPPPYEDPDDDPQTEKDQKTTANDDHTATNQQTTNQQTTDTQTSSSTITLSTGLSSVQSSTQSSSASGTAEYFIIAATNAAQAEINSLLEQFDPTHGTVTPDVGDTSVSGGMWINYVLSPDEVQSLSSRSDILAVQTCASVNLFPSGTLSSVYSTSVATTVSQVTLVPTMTANGKIRRDSIKQAKASDLRRAIPAKRLDGESKVEASMSGFNKLPKKVATSEVTRTSTKDGIMRRDQGTELVRQVDSPKDLSVLAWASGIPSVEGVDYISEETKGEFTWVYVVDSGVADNHWEFEGNWGGIDGFGKTNIDPNWVFAPGLSAKEDYQGHGTCMASKVCGKTSGVAKQTIVIPVVISPSYQSIIAGLEELLADIPVRRKSGQCTQGKTVVSISLGFPIPDSTYRQRLQETLQGIMMYGVIVVVAAGNDAQKAGSPSSDYPALLATSSFPLIRVGAVDKTGALAEFSQEGDVYTCGVEALCADKDFAFFERDSDGTSGATASFAGLVAYMLGMTTVPIPLGNDPTQFQSIVKTYFTTGHGAYARPGNPQRVAWNGLDGSANTVCRLKISKRDDEIDPENICSTSSIISSATSVTTMHTSVHTTIVPSPLSSTTAPPTAQTSAASNNPEPKSEGSIVVYYSIDEGCDNPPTFCNQTYFVYAVGEGTQPSDVCNDAIASALYTTTGIDFELPQLSGGSLDFVYGRTSDTDVGSVTGDGLPTPVQCSTAPSPTVSQTCLYTAPTRPRKGKRVSAPPPGAVHWKEDFFERSTCVW